MTKKKGKAGSFFRHYKPARQQNISITPSRLTSPSEEQMNLSLTPAMRVMIAESRRYDRAGSGTDRDRELCTNVLPLEENDPYPRFVMLALELNEIPELVGKPCPRDALKIMPYCGQCRKTLGL